MTRQDFKIYDDGKERAIAAFSEDSRVAASKPSAQGQNAASGTTPVPAPARLPRYVALLFDDLNIKQTDLMLTRQAAEHFLKEEMQPEDRAAVLTTSGTVNTAFTSDTSRLIAAMVKLRAHSRVPENGLMPCPRITPYHAYLIVSLDPSAIQAAVDEAHQCIGGMNEGGGGSQDTTMMEVRAQAEQTWDQARIAAQATLDAIEQVVNGMTKAPGSRVVMLASSGFLAETLEAQQERIIDKALAGGVVMNSLDAKGLWAGNASRTTADMSALKSLPLSTRLFDSKIFQSQWQTMATPMVNFAQSTGGQFFQNSNDLARGFRELAATPETTYRLGFLADDDGKPRYHKLKIASTSRSDFAVQSRKGYFSGVKKEQAESKPADTARERLDREVTAGGALTELPVRVSAEEGKGEDGAPVVWVTVHVDLKEVPFTKLNEREAQHLTFVTALLGETGNVVTAKESRMDLELSPATFQRLTEKGLNAKVFLKAPPGKYRLREVVQESVASKLAASTLDVEVH
jgi:VWFA-related protein